MAHFPDSRHRELNYLMSKISKGANRFEYMRLMTLPPGAAGDDGIGKKIEYVETHGREFSLTL